MKVAIIGGGGLVGSCAGFALQAGGIVREIAMIDANAEAADGQALDTHGKTDTINGVHSFRLTDTDDQFHGGDAGYIVQANGGDDTVRTGDGNDDIDGGEGNNDIATGAGDDGIRTGDGPGNDLIDAGEGGDYVRADEQGRFKLRVPDTGEYFLLVVSNNAARKASERLESVHLAQMGRYFIPAPDLIGDRKYSWRSLSVKRDQELRFPF